MTQILKERLREWTKTRVSGKLWSRIMKSTSESMSLIFFHESKGEWSKKYYIYKN